MIFSFLYVSRRVKPGIGSRKLRILTALDPKTHLNRSKRLSFIIVCVFLEALPSKASAGIFINFVVISFSISILIRTDLMFRSTEGVDQLKILRYY
jgi:hypothetical protein